MEQMMKAVVLTGPGTFEYQEVPVPEPGFGEVLCRVRAVAMCGSDPKIISGKMAGKWPPQYPFIIGHEWAGEVVKIGPHTAGLAVGDRVAGQAHSGCGVCENCMKGDYTLCLNYGRDETGHRHYGHRSSGAYAQYNVFMAKSLTKLPDSVSFQEGSLVDTAGTGLHAIELVGLQPGAAAVVIGPGAIGLIAAKLARAMGAAKVLMVGRGRRLEAAEELCGCLGINFEKTDPVEAVRNMTGGTGADIVIECSGAQGTLDQAVNMVKKGGSVSLVGIPPLEYREPVSYAKIVLDQIHVQGSRANPNVSGKVLNMIGSGLLTVDDLITHVLPLEKFAEGFDIFVNRKEGVLKVVFEP
jgi:L-iditol 2-dehydrogenase